MARMTPLGLALTAIAVLLGSSVAHAEYTPRFAVTAHGALTMTGNSLGLSSDGADGPGTVGSVGAFVTTDAGLQAPGGWPAGTTTDWTLDAAAAELRLPIDAEVLYAELVWGGYLEDLPAGTTASPVRVTPPSGAPVEVDPAAGVAFDDTSKDFYARAVDVTALVAEHGAGTWTVGHVPASLPCTSDCNLRSVGWTLVVAYARPDLPLRDLGVWVGLEPGGGAPATLSGLCTPSAGDVRARVLVTAMEGDHKGYGDNLAFGPPGGPLVNLTGPNNNVGNFFAAHINGDDGLVDTSGTFGQLNLTSTSTTPGRQGWDITNVDASDVLPAGATQAVAQGITSSEQYRVAAIGIQIDTGQPRFEQPYSTAVASPPVAVPGETVRLTWTLVNSGAEAATTPRLTVLLPAELTFAPGSLLVAGATSDADPTASPLALPELAPGASIVVALDAVVAPTASEDEQYPSARLTWGYTACGLANDGQTELPTAPIGIARLTATLDAAPATPLGVADTVLFTATFTNMGEGTTRNASLTVAQPAGLDYVAGSTKIGGVGVPDVEGASPFATARTIASAGAGPGELPPGASVTVQWQAVAADTTAARELMVSVAARGHADLQTSEVTAATTVTVTICGDGILGGSEACDHGDANSDETPDACRADCRLPGCGDGVVDAGEGCDDGDHLVASCDYGAESCVVCGEACQEVSGAVRRCGDGTIDEANGEACDDGGANSNATPDACREDCSAPRCGDGVQDSGERCDDGNDVEDDGCTGSCDDRFCGDGDVDEGEACDPAADPAGDCAYGDVGCTRCRADCAGPRTDAGSWCGDGRVDLDHGEVCDDGNDYAELCAYGMTGCAVCGAGCRPTAGTATWCGDGMVDGLNGEICDDGNTRDHDGCSSLCMPDEVHEDNDGCQGGAAPLTWGLLAAALWALPRRRRRFGRLG
ncbi:MAG: hypothetical protein EP329_10395 [Deltaproteobacteria bacterium]|nr:MAG: hypothetical protein EP329_10395 [Deltaproteobacteria bacterium]